MIHAYSISLHDEPQLVLNIQMSYHNDNSTIELFNVIFPLFTKIKKGFNCEYRCRFCGKRDHSNGTIWTFTIKIGKVIWSCCTECEVRLQELIDYCNTTLIWTYMQLRVGLVGDVARLVMLFYIKLYN